MAKEYERHYGIHELIIDQIDELDYYNFFDIDADENDSGEKNIKYFMDTFEELEKLISIFKRIYPGVILDDMSLIQISFAIEEHNSIDSDDDFLREKAKERIKFLKEENE